MKCLAVKLEERYEKANGIIRDLALYKGKDSAKSELDEIRARIKARHRDKADLCWNCRRPLPHKVKSCPYCGETV
jgi:hypothetical protein